MGIHILTGGFIRTLIQPNMEELMGNIQEGTLDFALTKPIDAQILISVRQFRLWQLVDVVLGFAVLLFAAYQMQLSLGVWQTISLLSPCYVVAVMVYTFWLLLTTVAFWAVRIDNMINLFQAIVCGGALSCWHLPRLASHGVNVSGACGICRHRSRRSAHPTFDSNTDWRNRIRNFLLIVSRLFWRRGLQQYGGASS